MSHSTFLPHKRYVTLSAWPLASTSSQLYAAFLQVALSSPHEATQPWKWCGSNFPIARNSWSGLARNKGKGNKASDIDCRLRFDASIRTFGVESVLSKLIFKPKEHVEHQLLVKNDVAAFAKTYGKTIDFEQGFRNFVKICLDSCFAL